MQVEVLSARGTRMTARRVGDSIVFLYRGRELACLPLEAILRRKAGLHLTRDEDPAFWLDYETLSLVIAVL